MAARKWKSGEERFWERVRKTKSCWLWLGAIDIGGYGHFFPFGCSEKRWKAHRYSFFLRYGKVPGKGLMLDHLCRQRNCVNPKHLEIVTPLENTLRGVSLSAKNAKKKRCKNGHLFSKANTLHCHYPPKRPARRCRICVLAYQRKYRPKWWKRQSEKKKLEYAEVQRRWVLKNPEKVAAVQKRYRDKKRAKKKTPKS